MRNKNRHIKGFSLVELVIVIVLLSILLTIGTNIIVKQFQIFAAGQKMVEADWQGRITVNRMERDIRDAVNIINASSNNITFINTNGETISYSLGGVNNTQLIYTTVSGSQPLANNVNSINFGYYDSNGNITASDIRYVSFSPNIVNNNTNFNITTAVYLWNMTN
jgi:prepilin-type N-terminal cleavage/methylation domain-containing protein